MLVCCVFAIPKNTCFCLRFVKMSDCELISEFGDDVESSETSDSEEEEVRDVKLKKKPRGKYICSYGDCREVCRKEKHLDMHVFKHTGIVSSLNDA